MEDNNIALAEDSEFLLDESGVRAYIFNKNAPEMKIISTTKARLFVDKENLSVKEYWESDTSFKTESDATKKTVVVPVANILNARVKLECLHYWFTFEYTDKEGKISVLRIRVKFNKDTDFEMGEERYFKYIDAFKEAGIVIEEPDFEHRKIKRKWRAISIISEIIFLIFIAIWFFGIFNSIYCPGNSFLQASNGIAPLFFMILFVLGAIERLFIDPLIND